MDRAFFFDRLYPLQDDVLQRLGRAATEFYLTGGTAASRGYLNHRFSEDLDLFVNDDERFHLWADRVIQSLDRERRWRIDVLVNDERFVRCSVAEREVLLKLEMVNDVPAHAGAIVSHETLGRLDSAENILANKVTALIDRAEPKDLADIWGFCCRLGIPLAPALEGARSKAAGVFPADLARILCSARRSDWELVRWIDAPPVEQFLRELRELGEALILPDR